MVFDTLLVFALYAQTPSATNPDATKPAEAAQQVAGQAPPAAPPPPAPAPSNWAGSVNLSLISITGNATAITFSGAGLAEYKTRQWIYGLKASATYGLGKPPTNDPNAESQVLALAASLQLRVDHLLTEHFTVYLLGGAETDHVKSVEFRGIGEAGVGLIWVEVKAADFTRVLFRTDLAFHYANESRFQYYPTPMSLPGATLYAPKLGLAFRYSFSKDVNFSEYVEFLPNVAGDSRVVINNQTKLAMLLVAKLSFTVGFTVNYDSAPAPDKKSTDTALSVGLEYKL